MEKFVRKDGAQLRCGYTTGSCAAAAAKAAAQMLLLGGTVERVALQTPNGTALQLPVSEICTEKDAVTCAVKKDSGDDPDITNGMLVYATVKRSAADGVTIDGGAGIGRVTKPGLDQPVGAAAINSVPRRMIEEAVRSVMRCADCTGGVDVLISAPEGEALARKTFNPRLGIVGGISILGTTGVVEPMSEQALVETIRVSLRQKKETGAQVALLTPGNYGADFIRSETGLDPDRAAVMTSNFIGDALDICKELGFSGALLIGHIGKLVKLAGNMMNTHSKYGDCRMELLAAHGAAAGLSAAAAEALLDCATCDDAIRILEEENLREETLRRVTQRIDDAIRRRCEGTLQTGAILFSKEYGLLAETPGARELLSRCKEE